MPYGPPAPYGVPPLRVRTSVGGLGLAVTILLAVDAALSVLALGFLTWRRDLLGKLLSDPASVDLDSLRTADTAARETLGWFVIVTLATIVVFLCWFRAARANAETFAPGCGSLGVGWAIGGWFVPVACLILPCIVARDTYRGTMAGKPGRRPSGGKITGWWWGMYVAFWITGLVVSGENGRAHKAVDPLEHLRDLHTAVASGVFALAVGTAAAALAIAYVRTITAAQKERFGDGWIGGPAPHGLYGTPYGYGVPMPGYPAPGYPMPGQVPGPPVQDMPGWGTPVQGMPVQAPPVQGMPVQGTPGWGTPAQDRNPFVDPRVAETQTADVQEPGDRFNPPS